MFDLDGIAMDIEIVIKARLKKCGYILQKKKFTLEFFPKGLGIFHVTNLRQSGNNFTEIMDKIFELSMQQMKCNGSLYFFKKRSQNSPNSCDSI